MGYSIEGVVKRFQTLQQEGFEGYAVVPLIEHGFALAPEGAAELPNGKKYGLTLMGITHGNEFAGAAILNGVLEYIKSGIIKLPVPVAFILGNVPAALENKRFLDRDLNRSFDRKETDTREDKRAREIETVIKDTALLVDFHQTLLKCDRSFFIFPYGKESFQFARDINPRQTIVTHWGKSFSADGKCTDEFVNANGGVGISLETGQNGFEPGQIAKGVDSAMWAIAAAGVRAGVLPAKERITEKLGEIFTFSEIVPWPDGGVVALNKGFFNFMEVKPGESIGKVGEMPIKVKEGGRIIFPKYLTEDQQASLKAPPSELGRFMKAVTIEDLPKDK
jgi:predicted deacylase